jgi:hypothetical protein
MGTIEKAIEIAARAHTNRVDGRGTPCIFHSLRLMFAVDTMSEKMTAVLHDIVGDTDITLSNLRDLGFPFEVLEAIKTLSRRKGESRLDTAKRAAKDPIARIVMLADVKAKKGMGRIPVDTMIVYQAVTKLLEKAIAENHIFKVLVDDNFHHSDLKERYEEGEYETLPVAIAACKSIIDDDLNNMYRDGMSAEELNELYLRFGEDPFYLPNLSGERFEARAYAKQRCTEICSR